MKDLKTCQEVFVQRLKEALDGKSISAFSKTIGIPERTINSWTRKETTPRMEYLILLSQALSCSIDYLVGLED